MTMFSIVKKTYTVGVAKFGEIDIADVESSHHVMILVDKIVTMEHIYTTPGREIGNHLFDKVSGIIRTWIRVKMYSLRLARSFQGRPHL